MSLHIYEYMYVCVYMCTHVSMTHANKYVYVCMHVYMYVHVYTYIERGLFCALPLLDWRRHLYIYLLNPRMQGDILKKKPSEKINVCQNAAEVS